ncbi:ABC transporter ATP-binding protein [Mycobacterium sp. 21AC1]|uniref:ABC transporter ATP-binding protein n=1 Tax=[Mycobacterium] appelbergii TaxID=2939269 RepID=UPI0029391C39|nr:ABC transporter ATP-binding protein [Mycobacterium sp. 21AC1]MDV3128446.1 ABC transporter ATP-binding protein [Mycobacterium sp. 21AC1]
MTPPGAASINADRSLKLDRVTQRYPSQASDATDFVAIRDVSVEIPAGQFVSVVGPTGCGKSTMLSAICGLRPASTGQVTIGDSVVTGIRKDVGFIFQQDALLPWRTAVENVELSLRFRGSSRSEARERARDWLARVGLLDFEDRYPHQLSGGMRKRVAVAATLVYEPDILLMDEPFSALDIQTRTLMENDLLQVWEQAGKNTVVFVTHDLEEAIGLSDRILVLSASPGCLRGDYAIELPRPRDLLEVKMMPDFVELYRAIWKDLEGEVLAANKLRIPGVPS